MKSYFVITLIFIMSVMQSFSQDVTNTLSPLLNFNFAGNKNSWTNVNPAVSYGWNKNLTGKGAKINWEILVGPYIGTTISIKDSTSFLPALMLPGNAGIEINNYFTFGDTTKLAFMVSPCVGLKVISGFTDSSVSLVQHYVQIAGALRYQDLFMLTTRFSWGWHNATDYSEKQFQKIFAGMPDMVKYMSINLLTKLTNIGKDPSPLYLNLTWRNFITKSFFYLPNSRIFTIGFSANLNLRASGIKALNRAAIL